MNHLITNINRTRPNLSTAEDIKNFGRAVELMDDINSQARAFAALDGFRGSDLHADEGLVMLSEHSFNSWSGKFTGVFQDGGSTDTEDTLSLEQTDGELTKLRSVHKQLGKRVYSEETRVEGETALVIQVVHDLATDTITLAEALQSNPVVNSSEEPD